ncbi:Scr1 family TA system antitoxin-like transcriptional regulator [Allosalinactinospora lopnorensis]|uniref:Scr1 family TA system antitoxin-like transcriptional regulator n=1 Tax=Allosalinactinospora lopnorensis TaxID=1352348 RepID=UPI0022A9DD78|nr:Scr1 family TA system antitoxin-like transcriptional regulator [Allosalinactinospora lopnorensis]
MPSLLREGKVELISFVIRESVFTDVVGDAKIMKKQLEHIARLAEEDAAQVQVLPASVRTGIKAYLPFQVLTLGIAQLVAVVEHHEGGMVIDEPEVVRRMATQFGRLQAEALSPSESLKLMCKIMEDRYGDVAQVQL